MTSSPPTEPSPPGRSLALPVDEVLDRLTGALRSARAVVLKAPTGSGKTTRVPPAVLDALTQWSDSATGTTEGGSPARSVIVLEPRRIAARAAARRIAAERGWTVGGRVGYQVRFERKAGADTRLLIVTEGILVSRLQHDPFLEDVGVVIFDEVHERSLNTDLALAMCRQVQREVRPDLKLIAMSATLDPQPIAEWFGGCPVIETGGRLHPVTIDYGNRRIDRRPADIAQAMADGIEQALSGPAGGGDCQSAVGDGGDLLAFLPGVGEIRRTEENLRGFAERRGFALVPLFGDLPAGKQDAALRRQSGEAGERRRIVLATNVAESSVTVDGVTIVVDSGLVRRLRSDAGTGLDRLEIERISQASADQRAGRAGRQAPGRCLRLWPEIEHATLAEEEIPEIRRLDLSATVLQLMAWGERDVLAMPWLEPPPTPAVEAALKLLRALGAIQVTQATAGKAEPETITDIGRQMAALPLHPRLARLMIEGARRGIVERTALAAALLSERSPFGRRTTPTASRSDLLDRVEALEAFETGGFTGSLDIVNRGAAQHLFKTRDQLLKLARRRLSGRSEGGSGGADPDQALLDSVVAAFPDRLARRRTAGNPRAVMIGGRGVRLARESAVTGEPLFVCVDLVDSKDPTRGPAGEGSVALVRMASGIDAERLPADRIAQADDVEFDRQRGKVVTIRRRRFDDLILSEVEVELRDLETAADLLAEAAHADPVAALGLDRPAVRSLIERIRFLAHHLPELDLPTLDPAAGAAGFAFLLPALCQGRRSLEELSQAPVAEILLGLLSHEHRVALEREAPERIEVPSGSHLRLQYDGERPPVLAVKIQEMFGLGKTPTVASGRVPVLLHLLAPSGRPQQVTDDLASFWANTYASVRKDLAGRYPKWSWPDDPSTALPERRPHRRRR